MFMTPPWEKKFRDQIKIKSRHNIVIIALIQSNKTEATGDTVSFVNIR